MSGDLVVPLIMRWLHILSAVTAVGGAIFMLFVLRPAAAAALQEGDHSGLREAIRTRWQRLVHVCILLFLVSGFYNYLVVMRPQHVDQPLYHALFGVKFLLALVVFVLALALSSSKAWSQRLRADAGRWLSALVLLAVAVVLISGFMRALPKAPMTPVAPDRTIAEGTER
jgi:uncharacterized membrane protein